MRIAATVLALLLASTLSAETIEGRVFDDLNPMYRAKVKLSAADVHLTSETDDRGHYFFIVDKLGVYTLTIEQYGFLTKTQDVRVLEGTAKVADAVLEPDPKVEVETITMHCSMPACNDEPPTTPYERPVCSDYERNGKLIESMKQGDRAALAELQRRHDAAYTFDERLLLAGALLGRVSDDRKYWDELAGYAQEALRFAHVEDEESEELRRWCEERDINPDDRESMLITAFDIAAVDPRAHPLLTAALESRDFGLVQMAIYDLAFLREDSFVPKIEAALKRFPDRSAEVAMDLAGFRWDAADRMALRFVAEEDHWIYAERRRRAEP